MNDKTMREIYQFAERVQPIYELLKWEWQYNGVPTVEEIVSTMKSLISGIDKDTAYTGTGGLWVRQEPIEEDEEPHYSWGLEIHGGFIYGS